MRAFNLCVNGKKIASGFSKIRGDVNLFGYESEPTFRSRTQKFKVEVFLIGSAIEQLSKWIEREVDAVPD